MAPFEIGAGGLVELQLPAIPLFNGQPDVVVRQTLQDYMELATSTLAGYVKDRAPVGVAGALRQSISSSVAFTAPVEIQGRVFSSLPYAKVVDEGRRPGPISRAGLASLALWVTRTFGVSGRDARRITFFVARKIRTQGFKGQRFAGAGFDAARPRLEALFEQMNAEIVARLVGHAGAGA